MSRFSIAGRSTIAPTANRAGASVYASASKPIYIREVGIYQTVATAQIVGVARFTTATNVGAGLTENSEDPTYGAVALATGFAGHTNTGGVGAVLRQIGLPNVVGSSIIWSWHLNRRGLLVPKGTANGFGIITPSGTGQVVDYYIVWDEV